ncbi:MAG: exonuclease domain-containing protein, partial [Planctomycetota bacterium]|nr:exonuclease domain-containing protein [Planctomycetota bacterium]
EYFSNIVQFAKQLGKPVTIFDTETNRRSPAFLGFRIIEIALLVVRGDGSHWTVDSLVNSDGRSIDVKIKELLGLTYSDLKPYPNWKDAWRDTLHCVAKSHVTVGFNSLGFDCPAIVKLNHKVGQSQTVFQQHIDVYRALEVKANLAKAAQSMGIGVEKSHRALPDVLTTARLLDKLIESQGLEAIAERAVTYPTEDQVERARKGIQGSTSKSNARKRSQTSSVSRKATRLEEIVKLFEAKKMLDLPALMERFGLARGTLENDVFDLIVAGRLPEKVLSKLKEQELIVSHLEQSITSSWQGENVGRLRPLKEWFSNHGFEISYLQLKIALNKAGLSKQKKERMGQRSAQTV